MVGEEVSGVATGVRFFTRPRWLSQLYARSESLIGRGGPPSGVDRKRFLVAVRRSGFLGGRLLAFPPGLAFSSSLFVPSCGMLCWGTALPASTVLASSRGCLLSSATEEDEITCFPATNFGKSIRLCTKSGENER